MRQYATGQLGPGWLKNPGHPPASYEQLLHPCLGGSPAWHGTGSSRRMTGTLPTLAVLAMAGPPGALLLGLDLQKAGSSRRALRRACTAVVAGPELVPAAEQTLTGNRHNSRAIQSQSRRRTSLRLLTP